MSISATCNWIFSNKNIFNPNIDHSMFGTHKNTPPYVRLRLCQLRRHDLRFFNGYRFKLIIPNILVATTMINTENFHLFINEYKINHLLYIYFVYLTINNFSNQTTLKKNCLLCQFINF